MLLSADKAEAFVRKVRSLRYAGNRSHNAQYLRQKAISQAVEYHGFRFQIPSNNKLLTLRDQQPNREGGSQIAAGKNFRKHPEKIYVDIGANIGDTTAVVRPISSCAMAVEPSNIFCLYLCKNVLQFGDNVNILPKMDTSGVETEDLYIIQRKSVLRARSSYATRCS